MLALLRGLSARHEVTLWAGNYAPDRTYAGLRAFPRVDVPRTGWVWRTPHADAVVTHSFGAHLLALRFPRTLCYLHTLRSVYLDGGSRPDLVARRWLDGAAVRRAAQVATNSAFTAERARQRYGRAIEVAPPGADDALFDLPVRTGNYALYVGRLAPEKGVERLLRWSAELPFDLVLVGAGAPEYVAHLRSLAGPRAQFRGPLTGDALLAAYVGCRLLAFLPEAEEFGLAALEAMAAGKPVVAAPEGGLLELVDGGRTGLFARDASEFATATHSLFASDALALQLGHDARERARAYTWARYVQRIEELCVAMVRGG